MTLEDARSRSAALFGGNRVQRTDEQNEIVFYPIQKGESLIVEAGAGTGKTFCFIELAKEVGPSQKILYLCFNNRGAVEAREKYRRAGVFNTKACTIHALAAETKALYESCGKFQTKITVKDIQKHRPGTTTRAWTLMETLKNFCESDARIPETAHVPKLTGKETPEEIERLRIDASELWAAMIDPEKPVPLSYDHYLKVFALGNPKLDYDYILLDEGQDSNRVTLSLVAAQRAHTKIIIIGDSNQGIYEWRGAHNAIESWEADGRLSLTESFRFGKEIAKAANVILKTFEKGGKKITGHKTVDSVGPLPNNLPFTLIARSNATLYETAINHLEQGKKFHFVGTSAETGWDPTGPYKFDAAEDAYRLYIGDRKSIRTPHIKAFETYEELKEAGMGKTTTDGKTSKGDKELESLCKLVDKHTHRLPGIIRRIVENSSGPNEADVLLVTCHRAKGLEWPRVKMADDFVDLVIERGPEDPPETPRIRLGRPGKEGEEGDFHREEINILYVAMTRAKERLEPNEKSLKLFRTRELLPPGAEPPRLTPVEDYVPEHRPARVEFQARQVPAQPLAVPALPRVKISYGDKDTAKEIARRHGGVLLWNKPTMDWSWKHPKGTAMPAELARLSQGKTHIF